MNRDEIMVMDSDQIEARRLELGEEAKTADMERLDAINAEFDIIEERMVQITKAAETRARAAEAVAKGAGKSIETRKEDKKMTLSEVRQTQEYIEAFAKYVRTGKDMECRALVTENIETIGDHSGPVPVPTFIEERIRAAWDRDEIWSRIRKTFVPGNLKVGFEISATDAVWHEEGAVAPTEEKLVLGIVNMVPKNIKKWITVSDEVLALGANEMLAYLYDEITYKIIKFASAQAMARIAAAPAASDSDSVGVPEFTIAGTEPTAAEVINAKALLTGEATDIVVICSRATEAALKSAALSAGYPYDPFDGAEVLHFEFPAATGVKMVIGDLAGILANLPEGDAVTFKFDDLSLAEKDLVKIVGRMMAAIEVVGPGMFVKVKEGN